MKATFYESDGVVMVNVETDASTAVDLVATREHKVKYMAAWNEYSAPVVEAVIDPPKKKKKGK